MDTYVVNTIEEFHKYFPLLKESAKTGSTPDTYLVGFDTEFFGKDNFPNSFKNAKKWVLATPNNIVTCIIQLATDKVCLVINLVKMRYPLPNNLVNLITNESWIKVGVGVELDLFHLSNNYKLGHCAGGIEIRNLALMAHYPKPNLEYMFNQMVGGHIKKTGSICDWSQELTESQLTYAARDAIMSLQLFKEIIEPSITKLINVEDEKGASKMLKINFTNFKSNTNGSNNTKIKENYIGRLNEIAQKDGLDLPKYKEKDLPTQHPPIFKFVCHFDGNKSYGIGGSKKEAKQQSAKEMYDKLNCN